MTFISRIEGGGWPDRIRRFRHSVAKTPHRAGSPEDREAMLAEIAGASPTVVITDSPDVCEGYMQDVASRVPLMISLDDAAARRFHSHLVINPTLGRELDEYSLEPEVQLLSGAKYLMVRSEFRRARNVRATEPSGPVRILIALGAGEVAGQSADFAKALLESDVADKIDLVAGTSKLPNDRLDAIAAEFSSRLTITGDARDLGARMTKAHLLITGGGNTPLEAGCVGIPTLMVHRRPEHVRNATWLEEIGVAQWLGAAEKVEPAQVVEAARLVLEDNFERKAMSRSGRMLIDGRGADRIVTATEIMLRRPRRRQRMLAA
jgi:UDP-2,4-diacetamido-2,4,6-trideoxy-beta-L-altropyranose hydrolase